MINLTIPVISLVIAVMLLCYSLGDIFAQC